MVSIGFNLFTSSVYGPPKTWSVDPEEPEDPENPEDPIYDPLEETINEQWRIMLTGGSNAYDWSENIPEVGLIAISQIAYDSSNNMYAIYADRYAYISPILCKYDSKGDLVWGRRFNLIDEGGETVLSEYGRGMAVQVDSSGNVYVAGQFQTDNFFSFVLKLDSSGNDVWFKAFNDTGVIGLHLNNLETELMVVGQRSLYKRSTTTGDEISYMSIGSIDTYDIQTFHSTKTNDDKIVLLQGSLYDYLIITKVDWSCAVLWTKAVDEGNGAGPHQGGEYAHYITIQEDSSGNIYTCYADNYDMDHIKLYKFDSTGNFIWSRKIQYQGGATNNYSYYSYYNASMLIIKGEDVEDDRLYIATTLIGYDEAFKHIITLDTDGFIVDDLQFNTVGMNTDYYWEFTSTQTPLIYRESDGLICYGINGYSTITNLFEDGVCILQIPPNTPLDFDQYGAIYRVVEERLTYKHTSIDNSEDVDTIEDYVTENSVDINYTSNPDFTEYFLSTVNENNIVFTIKAATKRFVPNNLDNYWLAQFRNVGEDEAWTDSQLQDIAVDSSGNSYVIGWLYSNNYDSGQVCIKLNSDGQVVWKKLLTNTTSNNCSITTDNEYVYMIVSGSDSQFYIVKMDCETGTIIWFKDYYEMSSNVQHIIAKGGYLYILSSNNYIGLVDANTGNGIWYTQFFMNASQLRIQGIQIGSDGYIYFSGYYSAYNFVVKVDPTDSSIIWERAYNSSFSGNFADLSIDDDDNLYINVDINDEGVTGLIKLNSDGDEIYNVVHNFNNVIYYYSYSYHSSTYYDGKIFKLIRAYIGDSTQTILQVIDAEDGSYLWSKSFSTGAEGGFGSSNLIGIEIHGNAIFLSGSVVMEGNHSYIFKIPLDGIFDSQAEFIVARSPFTSSQVSYTSEFNQSYIDTVVDSDGFMPTNGTAELSEVWTDHPILTWPLDYDPAED